MATIKTSINPWLNVQDGKKALAFYKAAFGATETYRMEDPDGGVVARLSIEGAEFWISGGNATDDTTENVGSSTVRMILTVANPELVFSKAIAAGATEIFPVGEGHGWKLGRIEDPFGLHWEIGHELLKE